MSKKLFFPFFYLMRQMYLFLSIFLIIIFTFFWRLLIFKNSYHSSSVFSLFFESSQNVYLIPTILFSNNFIQNWISQT